MPLCTRSEVYIGLVCPGIGLSHGAADDARRQGAGQVSAVIEVLRRQHWLLMMGMVSGDNRVGGEVYRCLLPILWHDNHT